MIRELKKYFNYLARQFFRPSRLNFLILYVTSNCNFKCRTCFFHKRLNRTGDLSLAEFAEISRRLGRLSILLIGGGEPFLRGELEEICSIFLARNKVQTLYIPTNGFLTDKILAVTENLLKKWPQAVISINPSLDGLKDYQEKTRQVKGSFDQAIKTVSGLCRLKKKYANLQVIVNSVVYGENADDLKKLAYYLRQFAIDYHAFEIMRGDSRDQELKPAAEDKVKDIHEFILANRRWYLDRPGARGGWLNRLAVMGQLAYTQQLKEQTLAKEKWPFKCAAGRTIAAVYPDGEVAQCELLPPIGNVRQYGYDLLRALDGEPARRQRSWIKASCCSCTHICFLNASLARDWRSLYKLPYSYFKSR